MGNVKTSFGEIEVVADPGVVLDKMRSGVSIERAIATCGIRKLTPASPKVVDTIKERLRALSDRSVMAKVLVAIGIAEQKSDQKPPATSPAAKSEPAAPAPPAPGQ